MKGIKKVDLHPENLTEGKLYKITSKIGKSEIEEIKEGRFVKIKLIYTNDKSRLGVQFQFAGEGLPRVIQWSKITSVELLKKRGGSDA